MLWRSLVWNALLQRNRPVATWMNGSCRGAARPLVKELCHSSQRSMTVITRSWHAPYLSCLRASSSSALTSVDGADEKGYDSLPPMDESVATHLCLHMTIGWKAKAAHPSSRVGQLKLSLDEPIHQLDKRPQRFTPWPACKCSRQNSFAPLTSSNQNSKSFKELCSATDVALRATKMTTQAIEINLMQLNHFSSLRQGFLPEACSHENSLPLVFAVCRQKLQ